MVTQKQAQLNNVLFEKFENYKIYKKIPRKNFGDISLSYDHSYKSKVSAKRYASMLRQGVMYNKGKYIYKHYVRIVYDPTHEYPYHIFMKLKNKTKVRK
jgi:hypothetical protein